MGLSDAASDSAWKQIAISVISTLIGAALLSIAGKIRSDPFIGILGGVTQEVLQVTQNELHQQLTKLQKRSSEQLAELTKKSDEQKTQFGVRLAALTDKWVWRGRQPFDRRDRLS